MSRRRAPLVLALAGLAFACATERPPFDDEEETALWANAASALGVWTNVHDVVAYTLGEQIYMDPNCPVSEDDGTVVMLSGGCTAIDGKVWVGEATIERLGGRDLDMAFDGFGHGDDEGSAAARTGTAEVRETGTDTYEFTVSMVVEGGMTTTIEYEGTVSGDFDTPTTWNGSGQVIRDGVLPPTGTVDAVTDDQYFDDVCPEAASGTTTLQSEGHTAVITYDGATDCDDDAAALWSVDGDDRGTIEGVTCAVSTTAGPAALTPLLLLPLAFRRRARD